MTVLSCRVTFDLWEAVYRVQVQRGPAESAHVVRDLGGVRRHCLQAKDMAVGTAANYRRRAGQTVYFAVLTELNPMNRETVKRIRRWLTKPGGGKMQGDAFFGSFVSVFVGQGIEE